MNGAGPDREADKGSRKLDATFRNQASVRSESSEPLAGQNNDVSGLTLTQTSEQPKCRREIRLDAGAGCRLILPCKATDRSHQSERRQHAYRILHLRSLPSLATALLLV
jgi:hypothetical protein